MTIQDRRKEEYNVSGGNLLPYFHRRADKRGEIQQQYSLSDSNGKRLYCKS